MNVSTRLSSSDWADPTDERLGLANCSAEDASHCDNCGQCTCGQWGSKKGKRSTVGCRLHSKLSEHPLPDVYDEPRQVKAILDEEERKNKTLSGGYNARAIASVAEAEERARVVMSRYASGIAVDMDWSNPDSDPIADIKAAAEAIKIGSMLPMIKIPDEREIHFEYKSD